MPRHIHQTQIASGIGNTQVLPQAATVSTAVLNFDRYPDTAFVSIKDVVAIAGRSRASIYRDHDAGLLPFVKLGASTRIKVGDLRRYMAGEVRS